MALTHRFPVRNLLTARRRWLTATTKGQAAIAKQQRQRRASRRKKENRL